MEREDTLLRESCAKALREIKLPYPFSVEAFCSQLGQQRNRPLHLHPMPDRSALSGVCGVWVATEGDDHIFYESRTSRVHQEHIILHEIGHVILGHQMRGDGIGDGLSAGVDAFLPDLRTRSIRHFLGRTDYTTRQEREAEMLASLIGVRVRHMRTNEGSEPLTRLGSAFGLGPRYGD